MQLLCEAERELSGQELSSTLKGGPGAPRPSHRATAGFKQLQRCGLGAFVASLSRPVKACMPRWSGMSITLICIQCGHSERLPNLSAGTQRTGADHGAWLQGFRPLYFHTFEIHGLCSMPANTYRGGLHG